uniref:Ig-like domain-containing protein n=1 Tax=Neolamprologus brichardi TaxID=32507 RepID=A0A3Q4G0X8_NEOBR
MNTLFNACFCLSGPPVIVKEGDDAILPCSVYDNRNIESIPFNWKKVGPAGQKVIFLYDPGNDGRTSQDEQFRGRVSHFSDKLKNGNASITIKNTKSTDNGKYICSFSDRNLPVFLHVGAAPEPSVTNLDQTNNWALLQCDVKGAYPKPTVEWWDSNNQTIPSEEPQVSKKGERFYVTLKTTVKKTGRYRCAATQKDIHHQIYKEINVRLNGDRSFVTYAGLHTFLFLLLIFRASHPPVSALTIPFNRSVSRLGERPHLHGAYNHNYFKVLKKGAIHFFPYP